VLYLIILYLQNVKGYSPLEAGVRTLPLSATQALTAANAGRLDRWLGARVKMTTGMLLIAAALLGLAQMHVTSSYDLIWPFEALLGLGMGLAMPAVSAAGMAAADGNQSGIASGVINAARQLGGSLGIAVLGSVAATLARADWHQRLSLLAPAAQARADHLTALVLGGQGKAIASLGGRPAATAGLESFVHGLRGALLASSALALVAAAVAAVGLRGFGPTTRDAHIPEPASVRATPDDDAEAA
jgi:Na+/melibiose symporter-like transporter